MPKKIENFRRKLRRTRLVKPVDEAKEVEYYAALVQAWLASRMEHDKSIFALSTAGIGLLLTLIATGPKEQLAILPPSLYIGALVTFGVTVVTILMIFLQNTPYIEAELSAPGTGDESIVQLDNFARLTFTIAIALTIAIGATVALNFSTEDKSMGNNEIKKSHDANSFDPTGLSPGLESLQGVVRVNPAVLRNKANVGALNSAQRVPATHTTQTTQTTQSSSTKGGRQP